MGQFQTIFIIVSILAFSFFVWAIIIQCLVYKQQCSDGHEVIKIAVVNDGSHQQVHKIDANVVKVITPFVDGYLHQINANNSIVSTGMSNQACTTKFTSPSLTIVDNVQVGANGMCKWTIANDTLTMYTIDIATMTCDPKSQFALHDRNDNILACNEHTVVLIDPAGYRMSIYNNDDETVSNVHFNEDQSLSPNHMISLSDNGRHVGVVLLDGSVAIIDTQTGHLQLQPDSMTVSNIINIVQANDDGTVTLIDDHFATEKPSMVFQDENRTIRVQADCLVTIFSGDEHHDVSLPSSWVLTHQSRIIFRETYFKLVYVDDIGSVRIFYIDYQQNDRIKIDFDDVCQHVLVNSTDDDDAIKSMTTVGIHDNTIIIVSNTSPNIIYTHEPNITDVEIVVKK